MQAKQPQVLKKASQLQEAGILKPLDLSIVSSLFWSSEADGSVKKRHPLRVLAKRFGSTVWRVRVSIRRLVEHGLLSVLKSSPLAGRGAAFFLPGKRLFQKMQKARRNRSARRSNQKSMARRYSRLPSQTVRKTKKKPVTAPVTTPPTEPELTPEQKAEVEAKKQNFFAMMLKKLGGGDQ